MSKYLNCEKKRRQKRDFITHFVVAGCNSSILNNLISQCLLKGFEERKVWHGHEAYGKSMSRHRREEINWTERKKLLNQYLPKEWVNCVNNDIYFLPFCSTHYRHFFFKSNFLTLSLLICFTFRLRIFNIHINRERKHSPITRLTAWYLLFLPDYCVCVWEKVFFYFHLYQYNIIWKRSWEKILLSNKATRE